MMLLFYENRQESAAQMQCDIFWRLRKPVSRTCVSGRRPEHEHNHQNLKSVCQMFQTSYSYGSLGKKDSHLELMIMMFAKTTDKVLTSLSNWFSLQIHCVYKEAKKYNWQSLQTLKEAICLQIPTVGWKRPINNYFLTLLYSSLLLRIFRINSIRLEVLLPNYQVDNSCLGDSPVFARWKTRTDCSSRRLGFNTSNGRSGRPW